MRMRDLMLGALGSGLVLGTVLGVTTTTKMKPAPEPPWRQAARGGVEASSEPVAAQQQNLQSYWSTADRTPTWKRHQSEYQTADYAMPSYADHAPPPEPGVADQPEAAETGRPADDAAAPATPPDPAAEAPGAQAGA